MHVLAGDIGGTKTWLGLYRFHADPADIEGDQTKSKSRGVLSTGVPGFIELRSQKFFNRSYADFTAIVKQFFQVESPKLDFAVLGAAGPIHDRQCRLTNLDWSIDADSLESLLGVESVLLVNDFHMLACALPYLEPTDLFCIQAGVPRSDVSTADMPMAVVGAGTGFGEATWIPLGRGGDGYVVVGEGGHADFAARNELEIELLQFLSQRHRPVAIEDVLSGRGLSAIQEFLESKACALGTSSRMTSLCDPKDISAMARKCPNSIASSTFDCFLSAMGSEAGNYALKTLPRGGLFVAGGIASATFDFWNPATFVDAFREKSGMQSLLAEIPIHVITEPGIALIGALALLHDRLSARERG